MKKIRFIAAALAAMIMLPGCGGEVAENTHKLANGDLIVLENDNKLNLAVSSFDTFNPIMTKSPSVAEFMKVVCEPLFEYDEKGNPIEVLAKNYAVSANGMTASFDVAKVMCHDGSTLTAADVVYTVNMIRFNDTIHADSVKYIQDIYADESGRVYISLTEPVVNFAGMLNFSIVKAGTPATADAGYIPVGTGAFKYHSKANTNQISFVANPSWHGGACGYKSLVVNFVKDSSTALHAFDSGSIDVISTELFKGVDIAPRGEFAENQYTSNALTFLGINNLSPKLSGKATRKALEMLIDREKMVSVELYSKGEPARLPINPMAWFCPELADTNNDYTEVEALLAIDGWVKQEYGYFKEMAGVETQLSLQLLVNRDSAEKIRIANNVAASLSSFGIPTTLRETDFETYKQSVTDKSYELFIGEVITDKGMLPDFLTASAGNYFGYTNPELESVVYSMACTTDTAAILESAKRYGEIFADDMPFVPLFFRKESVIYNKNISGVAMPTIYNVYRDIDRWYASQVG